MTNSIILFIVVSPIFMIFLLFTAIRILSQDKSIAATLLALQLFLISIWLLLNTFQRFTDDPEVIVLLAKGTYVPICFLPLIWFCFTQYFLGIWNKTKKIIAHIGAIVAVVVIALNWTTELHGLIYKSYTFSHVGKYLLMSIQRGPVFWMNIVWMYSLIFTSCISILLKAYSLRKYEFMQLICLCIGAIMPLTANAAYLFMWWSNNIRIDFTPWFFGISSIFIVLAMAKYRLFYNIPKEKNIWELPSEIGVIEIDEFDQTVMVNPVVEKIFSLPAENMINQSIHKLLPSLSSSDLKRNKEPFSKLTQINENVYWMNISMIKSNHSKAIFLINARDAVEEINKIKHYAETDSLTGILNRRSFLESANLVAEKLAANNQPYSMIFLDVDHFKKINDTYGHLVGDEILISAVKTIRKALRSNDLIGRFGGEEFVVFLPGVALNTAREIAIRINMSIKDLEIVEHAEKIKITISCGVVCNEGQKTPGFQNMLAMADQKMYLAKSNGRDRVEVMG